MCRSQNVLCYIFKLFVRFVCRHIYQKGTLKAEHAEPVAAPMAAHASAEIAYTSRINTELAPGDMTDKMWFTTGRAFGSGCHLGRDWPQLVDGRIGRHFGRTVINVSGNRKD
jgi:hypothetical protein